MGTRAQTSLAPYRHDPRTRLIELLKRWLRSNAANAAISEEEAGHSVACHAVKGSKRCAACVACAGTC